MAPRWVVPLPEGAHSQMTEWVNLSTSPENWVLLVRFKSFVKKSCVISFVLTLVE